MFNTTDSEKDAYLDGILNLILLLIIFSVITAIGNYAGYEHPISDSLIGIGILSFIALFGVLLERKLPFDISSIIYILAIGIIIALPIMPTSRFVTYYVSQIELISIVTVFLAYVGIDMGKNETVFKEHRWRVIIITVLVIFSAYLGSAFVDMLF